MIQHLNKACVILSNWKHIQLVHIKNVTKVHII